LYIVPYSCVTAGAFGFDRLIKCFSGGAFPLGCKNIAFFFNFQNFGGRV